VTKTEKEVATISEVAIIVATVAMKKYENATHVHCVPILDILWADVG